MSQRVKKPGRPPAEDSQGKRRRPRRPSGSEDADGDDAGTRSGSNSGGGGGGAGGGNGSLTGMWTPRHLNDLKVSSIYNRNSAEAPAELYRKDLISAMKLPDSEPLTPEEYWLITDSWKQEWEKGVQVPVNPESLPEPEVKLIQPVAERSHDFRLPKKKYVRVTHDDFFNPDYHQLVSTAARAEKVCSYDLDDVDAAWLGCSNADRAMQNTTLISEFLMEQVIEELELQCWEQVQTILKSQEGLGIEYDENVICDVCRSPESEEGNEMVFCDSCNICVHQACYGITTIPSGSWLCRTCTLGIKPACVLCPNVGGAMKATRSGHTWAHVACAIWIPEVSIGSVEKMEPITKISSIPQSRWSLVCVLCKEKTGACIQCSVKTCKTAYHVTCAFKNGLEMKPIIVDENAEDGIKLRSYCQKHSVNTKNKDKPHPSGVGGELDEQEKKKLKAMTAEERNQARAEKLQQIEAEFYKYVRLKDVSQNLAVDMDVVILIYNYWKLKRKSLNNRPLVPPRPETTQLLTQQQEQDLEQMKMFVQLRQDLERVRNLCYMVSRREKLSRSFFRLKEQTFQKQLALLSEPNDLTPEERQAVLAANHGPSIYDQFYSCAGVPAAPTAGPSTAAGPSSSKGALPDYETLITMIAGGLEAKKETLMNGIIKAAGGTGNKRQSKAAQAAAAAAAAAAASVAATEASSKEPVAGTSGQAGKDASGNPYRKQFVNGARRKNLLGESSQSESESESKAGEKVKAAPTTPKATPSPPVKGKKGKAAQAAAAAAAAAALAASTAAAAATTASSSASGPAAEGKVKEGTKGGKGASARKPLSYLFDSDSSVENALPVAQPVTGKKGQKGGAQGKGAKVKGGKVPPASLPAAQKGKVKPVAGASYLSDSDELELPTARSGGKETSDKPIYSDSEEEEKPKKAAGKQGAAVKKEKTTGAGGKKGKGQQQQQKEEDVKIAPETPSPTKKGRKSPGAATTTTVSASAQLETTSPAKGKGKAGGRKGKKAAGFDPTELIVPQREAAKKATESIRAVKQKAKELQKEGEDAVVKEEVSPQKEPVTVAEVTKKKGARQQVTSTLSESEEEEEEIEEKPQTSKQAAMTTRKGRSPERKVVGGKGKKGSSTASASAAEAPATVSLEDDEEDDNKDEFEFDLEKEAKNVSYVPQRQAAKKAAEHIRSGLSNIVAARLIIEDEMEATRKKQKTTGDGRKAEEGDGGDQLSVGDTAAKDKIESAVAEAAKKVTSKGVSQQQQARAGGGTKGMLKKGEVVGSSASAAVSGSKDLARGGRDSADWPFLDKGSQSACRRSRERSSSSGSSSGSSGSSSSGSSCSSSRSSSASSSRSSSAESASPEPRSPTPAKHSKASTQQIISTATTAKQQLQQQESTSAQGPGRKLKTSERVSAASLSKTPTPSSVRTPQTPPPREKPAPKGGRPAKSGARGGGDPFRSAFSPSPEPEPKPKSSTTGSSSSSLPSSTIPSSHTPSDHDKVSPQSKTANEKQQQRGRAGSTPRNQRASPLSTKTGGPPATPEKKGGRRKGESSVSPAAKPASASRAGKQAAEKDSDTESSLFSPTATTRSTTSSKNAEKRSPPKALAPSGAGRGRGSPIKASSLAHHTGPQLSSESETETTPTQPAPPPQSAASRKASQSQSQSSPSHQQKKRGRSSGPGSSTGGALALSDSESGTEEKENAQRRDSNDLHLHHHHHHASSPVVSSNKSKGTPNHHRGGSGTPAVPNSQTSILSPLTPTENKEKDVSRLSDTEQPESKRPRLDSTSSSTGGDRVGASSSATSGGAQQQQQQQQHIKSIFSPTGSTGHGRDHDMGYDFDSELYDLAKSVVTEEYTHGQEDGEESVGYSLHLNFTSGLFTGEDNREDSTQATLNLVKKLRQQHQQQNTSTGGHRSSTDCMSGQEDSPNSSRPGSSLQFHRGEESVKNSPSSASAAEQLASAQSGGREESSKPVRGAFAAISQMKSPSHSSLSSSLQSPDRTKQSIQGDERWVPPSSSTPQHQQSTSSIPKVAQPLVSPYQDVSPHHHPHKSGPPSPSPHPTNTSDKSHHQGHHLLNLRSPTSSTTSSSYQPSRALEKAGSGGALSVDTLPSPSTSVGASPLVSPLLGPPPPPPYQQQQQHQQLTVGQHLQHQAALAAVMTAAAEASPNNTTGLPFGFMQYRELANNPAAFASVVSSLAAAAAAAGANHPLAPFLSQQQAQTTKQGPGSPASSSYPPFIQPPPPPSSSSSSTVQGAPQHLSSSTVTTPTPSPGASSNASSSSSSNNNNNNQNTSSSQQQQQGRRPSDVSPLVSLATSMPSLAKPPLTSPSVLLAASNNCKSVCAPPLQSAVAHIIESVVNNHQASSSNLPKTTLSLDMMHLLGPHGPPQAPPPPAPQIPTSTNTISGVKTPLSSPLLAKVPQPSPISPPTPAKTTTTTTTTAAEPLSSPKFKDPQTAAAAAALAQPQPPPPPPVPTSGAGRGRRASTPRAAKQAAASSEKLSGVSAVIEDMMGPVTPSKGKGGRKGASPGRGKAPSTPASKRGASGGTGSGRGRGKGKSLVGVRKDLAGTVYDIDFDEFEEEAQEKIDLRSLRERRKSSEVHHGSSSAGAEQQQSKSQTNSSPLVLTLPVPPAYRQTKEEKRAQKEREKQERERERELAKKQKQLEKQLLKQQKQQQKLLAQQQREREREQKEREERESREKEREREPLVAPLKITLNDSIRQQQQREQEQDLKEAKEREQVKSAAAAAAAAAVTAMTNSAAEKAAAAPPPPPVAAILQTPLPGPVDMRTYSATPAGGSTMAVSSTNSLAGGTVSAQSGEEKTDLLSEKIGFPAASKDPSSEIASLFGMPSGVGGAGTGRDTETSGSSNRTISASVTVTSSSTVVNDFEELDKALEDLVSKPKPPPTSSQSSDVLGASSGSRDGGNGALAVTGGRTSPSETLPFQQQQQKREQPTAQTVGAALGVSGGLPAFPPGAQNTQQSHSQQNREDAISNGSSGENNKVEERIIPQIVPTPQQPSLPSTSTAESSDMSRNQLKVKIKGPFLDANYATSSASTSNPLAPSALGGVKVEGKKGKVQPPPARKAKQVQGPYLKTLKHVHVEQIARLQAKNQHECDLLEDIRNFTKQRSTIEKSYAEALLKLSSAYLNKKIPSIPDLRDEDEEEQWNVWNVWRTVLEENEKLARARLAAVEVFQQQITDDCKNVRAAKLQTSKKCLDQLQVVQKEVQVSVSELDRYKKLYFEEEHLAHDARDKVRDVEEKLKKKKGSIFSTFTSLQRGSVKGKQAKFSSKKEACEEKSTGARNDYIICLAQANAHSDRYFNVDLDGCIRVMEVDVYERLKDYLTIMGRTELLTCSAAQTSFTKIRDQAQMLSRDYNVTCCVQYYPVLKQHIRYPFDACEGDTCSKITCDHGAGMLLSREAKKWATKIRKELNTIRDQQRRLVYLLQLKEQGNKTDPDDPNGPDLETKIDEARDIIRKSETEKCKAEAVIECLRDGDVNVDEWMHDIENLTALQDMARSASSASIKTEASSQPQAQEAFYDSDANDAVSEVYRENETSSAEPVDRDEEVEAQIEQERKRIEALNTTWEDPLKMDWGEEESGPPEPPVTSPPPTAKSEGSSGTGGGGAGGRRESWDTDPTGSSEPGVVKCVAIYTYEAQNPDELSIVENEHLELIGEGDGDGWVRARNYKGEEGYVPQNYVEAEAPTSATMPGYPLQPQISFSSVDYHVQDPNAVVPPGDLDHPPALDSVAEENTTQFQQQQQPNSNIISSSTQRKTSDSSMPNGFSGGSAYPDHGDEYSHQVTSEDVNVAAPATSVSSGFTTPFINELRGEGGEFCRALYDYEATGPEELSFYEGQIIRLTKRDEDDGWWEGEYDGMKGIFPCIVAEECRWDGEPLSPEMEEEDEEYEEDDVSDSGILPPSYTPPEIPSHLLPPETTVIVTQPTPTVDRTSPANKPVERSEEEKEAILQNGDGGEEEEFAMQMSGDNQQKYQTQFGDEEEEAAAVEREGPQVPVVSIAVSDADLPDVTISISGPEDHEAQPSAESEGDPGLGVVQINILAATPMTEATPSFPGGEEGEAPPEEQEQEAEQVKRSSESSVKKKPAAPPPPPPPAASQSEAPPPVEPAGEEVDSGGGFADFSAGFDDNFSDNFADAFVPQAVSGAAPVKIASFEKSGSEDSATTAFEKVAFRRQSEPEEESDGGKGGFGGGTGDSSTPDDPLSSEPKVIEIIEPKEPFVPPIFSTMGEVAKAMKAAAPAQPPPPSSHQTGEQHHHQTIISSSTRMTQATNESPVTPEELDVQSLAKLESLKESDA